MREGWWYGLLGCGAECILVLSWQEDTEESTSVAGGRMRVVVMGVLESHEFGSECVFEIAHRRGVEFAMAARSGAQRSGRT